MKISDLRNLLSQLPAEHDDKDVVIREFGELAETENHYKLDKPIALCYYDEETNELALTELDNFDKFKDKGYFPVTESYVAKFDDVNEEGEFATVANTPGMGAAVLASRGVEGSGDVPSSAEVKKKKKRLLSFTQFSKK